MSRADMLDLVAGDAALSRLSDTVRGRLDDDPAHDLAHALRVALWTVVIGEPLARERPLDDRACSVDHFYASCCPCRPR